MESLSIILEIQELDIKMIRLARLKKQRQSELEEINKLNFELKHQKSTKHASIEKITSEINQLEETIETHKEKIKKLEGQQGQVKKIEEFNALTLELTSTSKEKSAVEQQVSDLVDLKVAEEEIYEKLRESLETSTQSGEELKKDITLNIEQINTEGSTFKEKKSELLPQVDPTLYATYQRLIANKKDRVIVPLVDRVCTGCNVTLTAQHENVVRRNESLVFCEHCSRIHFWKSPKIETSAKPARRRKKKIAE